MVKLLLIIRVPKSQSKLTFSSHFVGDTDGGYVEYGEDESGLDGESNCVGMLDIKFDINCWLCKCVEQCGLSRLKREDRNKQIILGERVRLLLH